MKNKSNRVCLFLRVSTDQQSYDRQELELTQYCESRGFTITKIISAKVSGVKQYEQRPDLQELFQAAKANLFDKVLVTEISRIGRSAKDIRHTIDFLHDKGISIVFKNLGGLESLDDNGNESFVTNIIIAIYSELAQEEKRILSERIKSGLVSAKAKGKHIGRPEGSSINKDTLLKKYSRLAADLNKGMSLNAAKIVHKVSKGTAIKIKKLI
ncbi:MAG: recombinase family protein [Bacteroidia bacterium]